ncbi:MAG: ABC transporter permease [Acidobacteriota bacterium]|nr:ABC transporter permease [Acidobacteriota bacterium]
MFLQAYDRADFVLNVPMDGRVLLFVALASSLVLLMAGVLPAWQTSDVRTAGALKSASRSLVGGIAGSRRVLLSGQVAMTLVVLISADLFTESLHNLQASALRFSGNQVLNAQLMPLPGGDVGGDAAVSYWQRLMQQLKNVPGVKAASLASFAPLVSSPYKEDIRRSDHPDGAVLQAPAEFVTEDFLRILRIPLLQGRLFKNTDTLHTPRVAILSQSVVRRLFPTESPLGRHVQFGTEPETRDVQVVGVAADSPLEDPHTREQGFVLLSLWQLPGMANWGTLQVEFSGSAVPIGQAVREQVHGAGHQQVFMLRTISDLRDRALLQERLLAAMGKMYSVLALVLAAVGLFGLLTFFVSTREREMALRMALGAERSDIGLLVLREAFWLAGMGVVVGLPLSLAASQTASTALYGVSSLALGPIILSTAILSVAVIAAVLGPMWRASSLKPSLALRQE